MVLSLIAAATAYPTVLWTLVLSFLALYWLLVAGGALEAEAWSGATDGEGTCDTRSSALGRDSTVFGRVRLHAVPLPVLATMIGMVNFAGCHYALRWFAPLEWRAATAMMLGVFLASLPVVWMLALPLRALFARQTAPQ